MFAYIGRIQNIKDLKAFRGFSADPFYELVRKGKVFAYWEKSNPGRPKVSATGLILGRLRQLNDFCIFQTASLQGRASSKNLLLMLSSHHLRLFQIRFLGSKSVAMTRFTILKSLTPPYPSVVTYFAKKGSNPHPHIDA